VLAIPPALYVWRRPSAPDLALLAAMGVLGTGIVMASTLYITLREARLGTSKPAPERID
jgi:hypothetical protein